jgi:hypothetical protein
LFLYSITMEKKPELKVVTKGLKVRRATRVPRKPRQKPAKKPVEVKYAGMAKMFATPKKKVAKSPKMQGMKRMFATPVVAAKGSATPKPKKVAPKKVAPKKSPNPYVGLAKLLASPKIKARKPMMKPVPAKKSSSPLKISLPKIKIGGFAKDLYKDLRKVMRK